MTAGTCEIGIVGLGRIGRNLALNLAGQGYAVAGYDTDALKVQSLQRKGEDLQISCTELLGSFVSSLAKPRTVMVFVPAGAPTDAAIYELVPWMEAGDVIIDGGNSHYGETDRRAATLTQQGILFLGIGISGGEQGARNGPSIMPGGDRDGFDRVRNVLEAAAARVDGEPCVGYLGPGSAGHYVKMLHNGIECGLMQLIAETYGLMKQGLGMSSEKLHATYEHWNREELASYLLEITAQIFHHVDDRTGLPLIDVILDQAGPQATAKKSIQEAIELDVPVPVLEMAIAMRALSTTKGERAAASTVLAGPKHIFQGDRKTFLDQLRNALYAGFIMTFAQGMAHLRKASHLHGYNLNLAEVARIWRGGIIRGALLKEMIISFQERPDLANLLLDPYLGQEVMARQGDLRAVARTAVDLGIPAPALLGCLSYYDGYRSEWLPVNLTQAQRDYLGAHPYERVDAAGFFHTRWHHD